MSFAAVRDLFDRAYALTPAQRNALFDAEGIDPVLRAEVEALLATADTDDVIGRRIERTASDALAAALPERVGAYRVLELIGEGGMGTVLLGERADGEFEMKVAIKLIRGYVSESARDRFRRERQVLATFDHPNIAGLVDGGTTPSGEPYLVMPYVAGETLGHWVARTTPSLAQRLALFLSLCHAVHYAHQRLVVHCDLKPGNVLVRPDGTPVLLDFGIAKLLEPGTDSRDGTATRLLTPRYASPEQLLGRAMTTATDVYGLGLILFEMLAGDVPERGDAIRAASVELPAPSKIAAASDRLRGDARRIRGDLDKIVRRAVRSEPSARYPSALALADDVESYLDGRPVHAAGGHSLYVLGKFLRRQRIAVAAAAVAIVALVAFGWQLRVERDRARVAEMQASREADAANAVTDFLIGVFGELDADEHPGRQLSARELLDIGRDRLAALPAARDDLRARLQDSLGWIYVNAGDSLAAIALLEPAVAELERSGTPKARVRALTTLARANNERSQYEPALRYAIAAVTLASAQSPVDEKALGHALMTRGVAEGSLMQIAAAEKSFARARVAFERAGSTVDVASVLHNFGWIAEGNGDPVNALVWYDRALAAKRAALSPDHPKVLSSIHGRGKALTDLGRHAEAASAFEELLERSTRVYGARADLVAAALNGLASANQDLGRYALAQAYYERTIALARDLANGAETLALATNQNNFATLLEDRGDIARAVAGFRHSLAIRERVLPAGHANIATPAHNLARLYLSIGRPADAVPLLAKALALRSAGLAAEHPQRLTSELLDARYRFVTGEIDAGERALARVETIVAALPDVPRSLQLAVVETRAELAQARGDVAARLKSRREAYALTATELPADHPRLAQRLLALAEAELAAGDTAAARAHRDQAAPVLRAALVPDAPQLADLARFEAALSR
jgi:eukaryotic-like serine/threonine-protein kinase